MGPEFGISAGGGGGPPRRPPGLPVRLVELAGLAALTAGLAGAGWFWGIGGAAAILGAYAVYRRQNRPADGKGGESGAADG